MTEKFFIDTADLDYIKNAWEKLSVAFTGKELVGVTTNPNAMAKVNAHTVAEMQHYTNELCKLVSDIRQDNKGVVYVQGPSSKMSNDELYEFAKRVSGWSDGKTKVGLKIAPYYETLQAVDRLNNFVDVNVTGVADCSTALRCFSYNVRYVSIIPGRMEEKGIDAKAQIQFVNERRSHKIDSEIITGSMRTLEGLAWAIQYNTVATIGSRVFDQIFSKNAVQEFKNMFAAPRPVSSFERSPIVTQDMLDLSVDFFNQMDLLGAEAYKDLVTNYKV
jgi:transaldolase